MTPRQRQDGRKPARERPRPLDVAVVGLACRFPGAKDVATFWANVLDARDCTGDVPADRWDASTFFDPDSAENDRVSSRRGGYLDAPIGFDPTRFGVMPVVAEGGEPEQFLVLDAARSALDDAGLPGEIPAGLRVEVVVGKGNYFNRGNLTRLQHGRVMAQTLGILRALHPEWTEGQIRAVRDELKSNLPPFEAATIPGQLTNATAGRVANRFDLSGASFVVDAASASSLVAADLGARSLVEGRADLAIVAGVYLQSDVDFPLVFSRLGALSKTGAARAFARSADGTLPGEGVGVVVLKRLADAERVGDRIYAVLKGIGLASDGRATGLASPSAKGHARALRRAYKQAGFSPATVGLVEGHGLGVPASDRAELTALNAVFPRPERGRRVLGAVTPLIGHAMPAAGMAGLIKAALALHHRLIPPTPHADDPHPLLADHDGPFALNPVVRPWIHGDPSRPRRAGVNAFGFAGVNAHAVLEEHAPSADGATAGCMPDWESEAVLLGADDRGGWVELARALLGWLESGENLRAPLKDLAFTLNNGQAPFRFRVGLVVRSTAELRDRLRSLVGRVADPGCASIRDAKGTYFWLEPLSGPGRLAFLYPGEGSQYPGMLADLCPHFPELRAVLDTSDRVAAENGQDRRPSDLLFGGGDGRDAGIWAIETAVNVVLSSQWAIHQLLVKLGLRPDAVVGHSSGEFLALASAGVVEVDSEFEDRLGRLGAVFENLDGSGLVPEATLVAVAADRDRVEAACRETGGSVTIAMDNCPHQVVVAGGPSEVARVVAGLKATGVVCEELPFHRAYHTEKFRPALGPLDDFFRGLAMKPPAVPVYSCATAARMGTGVEDVRRLAVDQWVKPVAFRSTVEAMYEEGVRLFVDVGARGNLAGFVEDTLRGRPHYAVAANLPRRSGLTQLNHLVASLYAQGVDLDPAHLYARRRPVRIDLSQDFLPAEEGPPLAVGFPEMRLSPRFVEAFRSPSPPAAPGPSTRSELTRNGPPPVGSNPLDLDLDFDSVATATALSTGPRFSERDLAPVVPAANPGAVLAYLKSMDLFLETQREVMDAYLGGRTGFETVPAVWPAVDEPSPAETAPLGTAEVPAATRADATDRGDAVDVQDVLLEQVSRRTGYPREMLDLTFDMEADLGIDSIKRVEILGELQARKVVPEGAEMDRLSRCRTLGQVLDAIRPRDDRPNKAPVVSRPVGWVGEVETFVPGKEFVGVRRLDARDDAVARHHTLGGRRLSAVEPDRLGLPVVPFTVMTELLAQAAATLAPGRVVVGLRDVQANRWIPYEDEPLALEARAVVDPAEPDLVRVALLNRGARGPRKSGADEPAVTGVVAFDDRRHEGPEAGEFALAEADRCRFTADELYRDQWLFHGPALQAVERVGSASRHGIEGSLRVLPRRDLLPERLWPALHTDPIVLDAFTHLLGAWGLDKRAGEEGDVIFPLRLASLEIFGDDPPEGASVGCRISVREVTRYRVRVDADLVAPDGRVWVAIRGWEDWRFYWPERFRDVFRMPDRVFVGEALPLPGASPGLAGASSAVWLEPPSDMGKPVWRDVLEWVQLAPDERRANRARGESEPAMTLRIWGRVAAKEAVRRVGRARGEAAVYPADLVVEADPNGRPWVRSLAEPGRNNFPAVSVAHSEGVAVALAVDDPGARVGIDVERIEPRQTGLEVGALHDHERDWLDRQTEPGDPRDEWLTRFWCAKEALGKATGLGLPGGPKDVEILAVEPASGALTLRLGDALAHACPAIGRHPVRCQTARRGEHAWAWTTAERVHE